MNKITNFILEFAPIITVVILVILGHLIVRSWIDKNGSVNNKPYETDTTYFKPTYPIRDTLNMVGDSSVRVILIIEKK